MKYKLGDTLIEVALAIGIFSLVAVSVVSVVSGSTSTAQASLELTITREDIDAQAEALRFIQSSYIAGGRANIMDGNYERYVDLWDDIVANALDISTGPNAVSSAVAAAALQYNPRTCTELYDNNPDNPASLYSQKAFIINPRTLETVRIGNRNSVNQSILRPASTFPRLNYSLGSTDASSQLYDSSANGSKPNSTTLYSAEGIFIVAIKDTGTNIITGNGIPDSIPAYYDFYIRTCWFTPGAERPSTISTVVRLQDPSVILYGA